MENVGIFYGECWYILWTFGIFYGHLVYFMDIWYILWTFGTYILWTFGTYILWTFGTYILWTFGTYILWTFGTYILWTFGIYYGHLVYFMDIAYISPVLIYCIMNNLATLCQYHPLSQSTWPLGVYITTRLNKKHNFVGVTLFTC
jgi:hypothetical protein